MRRSECWIRSAGFSWHSLGPQQDNLARLAFWALAGSLVQSQTCALPCRVLDWLKAFAAERKLEWQQDSVGNIVIRRPGSGGGEEAPPVVIQGGGFSGQVGQDITLLECSWMSVRSLDVPGGQQEGEGGGRRGKQEG